MTQRYSRAALPHWCGLTDRLSRAGVLDYCEDLAVDRDVPKPSDLSRIGGNREGDGAIAFIALPRGDGEPGAILTCRPLEVTPVDDIHLDRPGASFLLEYLGHLT